jgi:hypothetical protein
MKTFARASRALLQPIPGTNKRPNHPLYQNITNFDDHGPFGSPSTAPTTSPFGDLSNWDILWLGHCGVRIPPADYEPHSPRFAILGDETVPEKHHIDKEWGDDQLLEQYPEHTRLIAKNYYTMCSLAYAVTLPAARKIIYELGLRRSTMAFDMELSTLCDGSSGRPMLNCLAPIPQLFQHHRPISQKSDWSNIVELGGGEEAEGGGPLYTKVAFSKNIRWSTKANLGKLVYGDTNYTDLYLDGEPTPELDE